NNPDAEKNTSPTGTFLQLFRPPQQRPESDLHNAAENPDRVVHGSQMFRKRSYLSSLYPVLPGTGTGVYLFYAGSYSPVPCFHSSLPWNLPRCLYFHSPPADLLH